jgi:hypothetical protein
MKSFQEACVGGERSVTTLFILITSILSAQPNRLRHRPNEIIDLRTLDG